MSLLMSSLPQTLCLLSGAHESWSTFRLHIYRMSAVNYVPRNYSLSLGTNLLRVGWAAHIEQAEVSEGEVKVEISTYDLYGEKAKRSL